VRTIGRVIVLMIAIAFAVSPLTAYAETVSGGTFGENLTWDLDDEGTLTIGGSGPLDSIVVSKESVKKVIIEDGITCIGDNVFEGCSEMTSIVIPDSVTSIGSHAFTYCSSLEAIDIPDSVMNVGYCAFWGCGCTSISIPDNGISIDSHAFTECNSVRSITIPGSVKSFGESVFAQCDSLSDVIIEDGVTIIADSMFAHWLLRAKVNTVPFLAVHRPAAKRTHLRKLMDAIPRKMDTSAT